MKLKDGFEVTQEDNGLYVARAVGDRAAEYPQAIQMGLSGAFLWDLLSRGDCSRAELIMRLEGLFDTEVSTDQVAADVETFLTFLRQQNLLEEDV